MCGDLIKATPVYKMLEAGAPKKTNTTIVNDSDSPQYASEVAVSKDDTAGTSDDNSTYKRKKRTVPEKTGTVSLGSLSSLNSDVTKML